MLNDDPVWLARKTPSLGLRDHGAQPDMVALRAYRLERTREQLRKRDYAGCVLFDPINIRYATGSRNMSVWTLHNPARYCFIATDGPIVLFDFPRLRSPQRRARNHRRGAPDDLVVFLQLRLAHGRARFEMGEGDRRPCLCAWRRQIAVSRSITAIPWAHRLSPVMASRSMTRKRLWELARAVKSSDEVALMSVFGRRRRGWHLRHARSAETRHDRERALGAAARDQYSPRRGVDRDAVIGIRRPHHPWFHECSERIIRPGELVAFDTDLIGPFGYCADISRTFFCGPGRPNEEQRALYGLALEQIHYNMELLRPGLGFRELSEKAWRIPNAYWGNRYSVVAHGVGMADEYPHLGHIDDYTHGLGYDGALEANMTLCVESYIGAEGGAEGVKLEQQVLITETGVQLLSPYPFEEELME
jgi:Xaa-Pro aminopeptidase